MVDTTPASSVLAGEPASAPAPVVSDAEIADAVAAVDQIGQLHRGLAAAARIAPLVQNARGVLAGLNKQIADARAKLSAANAETIDAAKAEGERQAKVIVEKANTDAAKILADAQSAGAEFYRQIDGLKAERDSLRTEITNLKASAKALAG